MLITFKTRARCPDITMFGDVALRLLKLMGRRDTVPSAMEPEDIPAALRKLREGLALEKEAAAEASAEDADEEATRPVSLQTRAMPLVELLETALKEDVPVMWEEGGKRP